MEQGRLAPSAASPEIKIHQNRLHFQVFNCPVLVSLTGVKPDVVFYCYSPSTSKFTVTHCSDLIQDNIAWGEISKNKQTISSDINNHATKSLRSHAPILLFDVNINRSAWPLPAWFYGLHSRYMIAWPGRCTVVPNKVIRVHVLLPQPLHSLRATSSFRTALLLLSIPLKHGIS